MFFKVYQLSIPSMFTQINQNVDMGNIDFTATLAPMKLASWNLRRCIEPYQKVMVMMVWTLFQKLDISYLQEVKVSSFLLKSSLNIYSQMQRFLLPPIIKERYLLQLSPLPH
jgi:hypothetical protein